MAGLYQPPQTDGRFHQPPTKWWMIQSTTTNSDGRFHQPPTKWWMIQSTTTNSDGRFHQPLQTDGCFNQLPQTVMDDSTNHRKQWWTIPPPPTNSDGWFHGLSQTVMVDSTNHHKLMDGSTNHQQNDGWFNQLRWNQPSLIVVVGRIVYQCLWWLVESSITVCVGWWNPPSLFVMVGVIIHHCLW
jgi:hypothetical protein